MKKQIMSIAAAAAILTTGAMAFDYTYDGEIVADITNATLDKDNIVTGTYASYLDGFDVGDDNLTLSPNNRGDALIYPAFKAGDEWSSEVVVRNAKDSATVCKVVLYAADNSRELLDFDIHLSPYDVFRFNIAADGTVSTNDGSFAKIDPTLSTNDHKFIEHNGDTVTIGNITSRAENVDVTSGYVSIYAMVQAENRTPAVKINKDDEVVTNTPKNIKSAYHGDHSKLLTDFRHLTDLCRDQDGNMSSLASWRTELDPNSAGVVNGTAADKNVTSPNVNQGCLNTAMANNFKDDNETNKTIASMTSTFISPESDLLFGDITISTGGEDPRNLLIQATALENFTGTNQMMLWAPGEYAAIQDRRIVSNMNTVTVAAKGNADDNRSSYSDYNLTGIKADSETFNTAIAYYTFDDNAMKGANTLLVTQPTKRALIMAKETAPWVKGTTGISPIENKWGEFRTKASYYDENELLDKAAVGLAVVTSPVSGDPEFAYKKELQDIRDPERSETASSEFQGSLDNGFAIITLPDSAFPSIITQMTGSVVEDESQINWVYSTITK